MWQKNATGVLAEGPLLDICQGWAIFPNRPIPGNFCVGKGKKEYPVYGILTDRRQFGIFLGLCEPTNILSI